jgi:hypothetical protein
MRRCGRRRRVPVVVRGVRGSGRGRLRRRIGAHASALVTAGAHSRIGLRREGKRVSLGDGIQLWKVALELGEVMPESAEELGLGGGEGDVLVVVVAHLGGGVWGEGGRCFADGGGTPAYAWAGGGRIVPGAAGIVPRPLANDVRLHGDWTSSTVKFVIETTTIKKINQTTKQVKNCYKKARTRYTPSSPRRPSAREASPLYGSYSIELSGGQEMSFSAGL